MTSEGTARILAPPVTEATPRARKKLTEIQRPRAMAVLMVLLGHTPLAMPDVLVHGYTGVSLFLVISGYVVSLTFLKSYPKAGPRYGARLVAHLRDFYIRRVFRILPVALAWVGIYFIAAQFIGYLGGSYGDMARWVRELKWLFSGFFNYHFAASGMPGLFGHYWSLAVEMHFYLVFPLLFLILRKRSYRLLACGGGMILVITVLRMITPAGQIGLLTHTQADALLLGVLLFLLAGDGSPHSAGESRQALRRIPQWLKNTVAGALLLALLVLPAWFDKMDASPLLAYPVYTLVAGVLVYLAQRDEGWVLGGSARLGRMLEYLGDRSYSLYVCHIILYSGLYPLAVLRYPVLFPAWLTATPWGIALQFVMLVLVAIAVSEVSYRLIEKPYIDYGKSVIRWLDARRSTQFVTGEIGG